LGFWCFADLATLQKTWHNVRNTLAKNLANLSQAIAIVQDFSNIYLSWKNLERWQMNLDEFRRQRNFHSF